MQGLMKRSFLFLIVLCFFALRSNPLLAADNAKPTALAWVDENSQHIIELSQKLNEFKETGLQEFKSSDLLVGELEANGFKVERGQAGMPTAFVGTFSQGSGRPVIGILAEFDALPNGHTCGHNLFGAGSIGAAIALKEAIVKNKIDGTLKLFGTPSEDTHGGKVWLAREGVFKGVDVFLDWHPDTENRSNIGSNLAVQILSIDFYGKSSHAGAAPEKGRSALDALMLAGMGLEFLREHMIEPMRIQYIVSNGGQAPNVVPEYSQMKLVIRGPKMADIEYLRSREGGIDDCLRAGALATGCDVTLRVVGAFYNRVPNKTISLLYTENMKALDAPLFSPEEFELTRAVAKKHNTPLGKLDSSIYDPVEELSKSSADTGDVSYLAPLATLSVACAALDSPGHSLVNVDQYNTSIGWKGLIFAVKTLAITGLDFLSKPEKLAEAKKEFQERLKGLDYHAVISADLWPPVPKQNPPDFRGPAPKVHGEPAEPKSLLFWK
jgi:aminobenzoyl-glutamate utilization protein B